MLLRVWRVIRAMRVAGRIRCAAVLSFALLGAPDRLPSIAQEGPPGITSPVVLPPFDAAAPHAPRRRACRRVLAFAQDNERQFMQGVARGLSQAAKDRGLEYQVALADNDPKKMIEQVQGFLAAKVGAVVAAPVDPPSLSRSLQQVMWAGGYVGTVVPPPATTLLNAPQYLTGKVLGDAAAAYIKSLGGKAKVVLLTHDNLQFVAPRFVAMRDLLKDMPGVTIVADISPLTVNEEGGAATMRTVLLANPSVDVVLGADTVVLGALAALREAGKARPDQFLGGIDGEPEGGRRDQEGRTLQGQRQPRFAGFRLRAGARTPRTGWRARASPRRWIFCPSC